jgi:uncharacterized protein (DUF1330 family)
MAKGYWVVHVDVNDAEGYKAYVAANAEPLRKYNAKFLVRGGKFEGKEGSSRARNVVIEFRAIRRRSTATTRPNISAHSRCARLIRPPISSSSRAMTARSHIR